MLKNITLGQFFPGESPVHRMDPRMKLIFVFTFVIAIFFVKTFICYGFIALFLLSVMLISRISIKFVFKGIRPILFIVIFTFILNAFVTPGETILIDWWIITITKEGLQTAFYFAIRLILLVIGSQVLSLTTSPLALTDAIERLFNPLKKIGIPVHELAMMMTIALRFIPTLLNETDRIMKAQMSRGADFESGNLINRAKNLVPLMVPLFICAFRRADELALAMEARCYRGGHGRTRMKVLKLTSMDIYGSFYFLIFILAVAADVILAV